MNLAAITSMFTLLLETWDRISARRQASETLTSAEKTRAALTQTGKNTEIYNQIVAEAEKQIAESTSVINNNFSTLEQMLADLKAAAGQPTATIPATNPAQPVRISPVVSPVAKN